MKNAQFGDWSDVENANLIAIQNVPMVKGLDVFRKDTYGNDWQGRVARVRKRHHKQEVTYMQFQVFIEFDAGPLKQIRELYEFIPGYIGGLGSEATQRKLETYENCPQCDTHCSNEKAIQVLRYDDGELMLVKCLYCVVSGYEKESVYLVSKYTRRGGFDWTQKVGEDAGKGWQDEEGDDENKDD